MTWQKIIALLAGRLRRHVGRCACPLCDQQERGMREMLGMPRLHPESLTRGLPAGQEEELAALADELWPDEEWTGIIIEVRRAEGQP
jgi:hypothetical protein